MEEQDRQHAIHLRLARMAPPARRNAISTGFASLDRALGGGLPRGRIVEIFGPDACGKTTLALQMVAHLQQAGGVAAWIDADHTFDPAYARSLHVDIARVPVAEPESAEQALEIVRQLAASSAVDLLVVDTAAALVPEAEMAAGIGDSAQGLQSRVLASALRKVAGPVGRSDAAVVFLNQARQRMEEAFPGMETSAGGHPLKLHSAVRIVMSPVGGGRIRLRLLKNKMAAPFAESELHWKPAQGFAEAP